MQRCQTYRPRAWCALEYVVAFCSTCADPRFRLPGSRVRWPVHPSGRRCHPPGISAVHDSLQRTWPTEGDRCGSACNVSGRHRLRVARPRVRSYTVRSGAPAPCSESLKHAVDDEILPGARCRREERAPDPVAGSTHSVDVCARPADLRRSPAVITTLGRRHSLNPRARLVSGLSLHDAIERIASPSPAGPHLRRSARTAASRASGLRHLVPVSAARSAVHRRPTRDTCRHQSPNRQSVDMPSCEDQYVRR
jgi:hypothetical protein